MSFFIVGDNAPIYSAELVAKQEDAARLNLIALSSALDKIDMVSVSSPTVYLKTVDRNNEQLVYAYTLPGGVKFVLLTEFRNDDLYRSFFQEVHEAYLKLLLNPFYIPGSKINLFGDFSNSVRAALRKLPTHKS